MTSGRAATEIRLFKNYRIGTVQIPRILTNPLTRMLFWGYRQRGRCKPDLRKHRSGKKEGYLMISYYDGERTASEWWSPVRISKSWEKNKCRQQTGSQINVFKPEETPHSPTLNSTNNWGSKVTKWASDRAGLRTVSPDSLIQCFSTLATHYYPGSI